MKRPHSILFYVFSLVILAMVSSCAKEEESVTLNVTFQPFISNAPFFIGIEEGFFEEQGFKIEQIMSDRTAEAIPALEKGEIHAVGGLVNPGLINAIARGANIKSVADKGHITSSGCNSSALFASNQFLEDHPLRRPEDLKGARICIVPASMTGYWIELLLQQGNLSLDDITDFRNSQSEKYQLISEGAMDLVTTDEPWITRLAQGDYGEIWVSYGDLVPDATYAHVWFGPALLEDNPDLGKRFMVAYLKAVAQYNEGKTDRNLEILEKYLELDREILLEACWPSVRNDGKINSESVLDFQNWALEKGYIDSIVAEDQFWDPRFIEYALEVLEISENP